MCVSCRNTTVHKHHWCACEAKQLHCTHVFVNVEVLGVVGVDGGDGVEGDERVLDVRRLVLGADVRRALPEPRTPLHSCQNQTLHILN